MPWVVNACGRRGAEGAGREFFVSIGFVTWVLVRGRTPPQPPISVRSGGLPEGPRSAAELIAQPRAGAQERRGDLEQGPQPRRAENPAGILEFGMDGGEGRLQLLIRRRQVDSQE